MQHLLVLLATISPAFASGFAPLLARQYGSYLPCSQQPGYTACGNEYNCIADTWTCCPDGSGGCPPTASCSLGSNGKYGCCPNGESCEGDGGASTGYATGTVPATIPVPTASSYPGLGTSAPSVATTPPEATPSESPSESPSEPPLESPSEYPFPPSSPTHSPNAAPHQLAFGEMTILGSLLVGLFPGFLG